MADLNINPQIEYNDEDGVPHSGGGDSLIPDCYIRFVGIFDIESTPHDKDLDDALHHGPGSFGWSIFGPGAVIGATSEESATWAVGGGVVNFGGTLIWTVSVVASAFGNTQALSTSVAATCLGVP